MTTDGPISITEHRRTLRKIADAALGRGPTGAQACLEEALVILEAERERRTSEHLDHAIRFTKAAIDQCARDDAALHSGEAT